MNELGQQILFANIAFSAAIVIVLLLRKPVRAGFGARLAYALWLLPLFTVLAGFLPPRVVDIAVLAAPSTQTSLDPSAFDESAALAPVATASSIDPILIAITVWIAGAIAMTLWLCSRQLSFQADMRRGKAGPAVVGFFRPRIVMPDDFEAQFDARHRRIIVAHETVHLRMHDARINGIAALLRCLCWYNPLVHIAAHCLRIDQEMACDASVIERHPNARRLYADALLRAQLVARPLPLGCYWPPGAEHPLTERIEMLKRSSPGRLRRTAGIGVLSAVALSVGYVAWGVLPEERIVEVPYEKPSATAAEYLPSQSARYLPPPGAGYDHDDHVIVHGLIKGSYSTADGLTVLIKASHIQRNGHIQPVTLGASLWRADPGSWADQRMTGGEVQPGAEIRVEGYVSENKRCAPDCRLQWLRMHTGPEAARASGLKPGSEPINAAAHTPAPAKPASSQQAAAQSPAPPAPSRAPAVVVTSDLFNHDDLTGIATYSGNVELRVGNLSLKADRLTIEKNQNPSLLDVVVDADRLERESSSSPTTYIGNVVARIGDVVVKADRLTAEEINKTAAPSPTPISHEKPQQPPAPPSDAAKTKAETELAKRLGLLPGEKPGPAFASLFDAEAPLRFTGTVTKVELGDPNSFIWVESDKLYKVMGGRARGAPDWMKDPSFIGKTVTVRGYLAKDKTCAPDCLVNGRDVILDGQPQPWMKPPSPPASPVAPEIPPLPALPPGSPPPRPPT